MYNSNEYNKELKELEVAFHNKVLNLSLDNQYKASMSLFPSLFKKKVRKEIDIDTKELAGEANRLMKESEGMTDKEVAIELLKFIKNNDKSKTMRKLASKMIEEKWWEGS